MWRFLVQIVFCLILQWKSGVGENSCLQSGNSALLPVEDICRSENMTNVFRPHSVSITEFGAVGDGRTVNTLAFQNAVFYLQSFAHKGGAQLYVPAGLWLTGSFRLISHLTLFLDNGAVILASQDPDDWPVVDPLPSYGRGRDMPGSRHKSLIYGNELEDVVITGANGTIDGQGSVWWNWFDNSSLNHSRGHLIELVNSKDIVISNITLQNSPFWTIHPVYCRNVVVRRVSIFSPPNSPNTDGIVPDSSSSICIEDCSIQSGGDGVSIKSGWDQYGIDVGIPSANVVIQRLLAETPSGAGISFGSEMSGGIKDVLVRNVRVRNSWTGVKVKTAAGRGGYVTNVTVSDVHMNNVHSAINLTGKSDDHPDGEYDPLALPKIKGIYFHNITGRNISYAGSLQGLKDAPFMEICLSNVTLHVVHDEQGSGWDCCNIQGSSHDVLPEPCPEIQTKSSLKLVGNSWGSLI